MVSSRRPPDPNPWRELQRRRVGRMTVLYAAISFAIAEAALLILPGLGAPSWAFRAVLGVLVLAFPPSIVLAWRYDVTPKGIVRTPDAGAPPPPPPGPRWGWAFGASGATLLGLLIELLR